MPLEHKANVTSVTVLTEWGGEVSVISTTFHWASEAMTHICFSVSPSRSVQRVALLKQSLWRRMLQDQLGRSAENGNKRQSINCRASKPEKLSALSLCSFLSILILSSKTFSYQSIPSLFLQSDPFVRFHENRANGVVRLVLLTCLKGAVILQRAALHWWFGMRRRLYVCVGMAFIYYVAVFYVSACMCKYPLTRVLLSNSVVVRLVLRLWIKTWPSRVQSDTSFSVKHTDQHSVADLHLTSIFWIGTKISTF